MAKELAWKASKVLKPRGFESHALRQNKIPPNEVVFLFFVPSMGLRTRKGASERRKSGGLSSRERSKSPERGLVGRQMRPAGADAKSHAVFKFLKHLVEKRTAANGVSWRTQVVALAKNKMPPNEVVFLLHSRSNMA